MVVIVPVESRDVGKIAQRIAKNQMAFEVANVNEGQWKGNSTS